MDLNELMGLVVYGGLADGTAAQAATGAVDRSCRRREPAWLAEALELRADVEHDPARHVRRWPRRT